MTVEVALLAPIPNEHLVSGMDCCAEHGRVAYGSRDFEVFRRLDEFLDGSTCDVLIYASWQDAPPPGPTTVTWRATYLRHTDARSDGSPPKGIYRPASTEKYLGDQKGHWAVYWEVTNLAPLSKDEWLKVYSLRGIGSGKTYQKSFRPERPLIIEAL